jgi:hypothetical protein
MNTETTMKQSRKSRKKAAGSTATVAEVAASHIPTPAATTSLVPDADAVFDMGNDSQVKALIPAVNDELAKRHDPLNAFLADLPKPTAADVRKETKALVNDLREAAGALTSAALHIFKVRQLLNDEDKYMAYESAIVAEGYITKGTAYTLRKKVEVFEQLALPDAARTAIMSYSGGDSVIVRRQLTVDEQKAWKTEHPATKAPKGIYEASPYFVRSIDIVEAPAKWSPESADSYAGQVLRLAAKLRGKARSGNTETSSDRGDTRKLQQFGNAIDRVTKMLEGEDAGDGKRKGMIVFSDTDLQNETFTSAAKDILSCVLNRLPLDVANALYEECDILFKDSIEAAEKRNAKQSKAKAA